MLNKLKVGMGSPTHKLGLPLRNPMAHKFATTGSVDSCSVLPETQICREPPACGHHTSVICRWFHSPMAAAGVSSEFDMKPPLGAPLLIFPRGHVPKSFPQGDTSARQRRVGIRFFLLLFALPNAIESNLPVFHICCR